MSMHRAALIAIALTIPAASLAGQATAAAPPPVPAVTVWSARNWTRAEVWRFFEPPAGGGNNDYVYAANRFQGGLRRTAPRYEVTAAFEYVQFGGLPMDAVGPGPLGAGAVYFAHAGRSDSRQVYLRYLNLRLKDVVVPGLAIQAGRMAYASGSETVSGDSKIEAVKRQRVDARLIGEFEWSLFQRAYDGVRADFARPDWSLTAVAVQPTQGGFEDAAGLMMKDVAVFGSTVGLRPGVVIRYVELQGFALRYLDRRRVPVRADNTGRAAEAVDVAINSFGATLVGASPSRNGGQWDAMLWLVGQSGSWYGQPHGGGQHGRRSGVPVDGGTMAPLVAGRLPAGVWRR
jgi:hypothetical protein